MNVPRTQGLAALYKNCIYYIAGICRNHQRTFTVEVYDIEQNTWCRKRDLPFDQATSPYIKVLLLQGRLHLFVRATQVMVEEHVFRTSRKNSLYQYDDDADQWTKVYETPDRLWDLGRHFECVVAKLYPQCLQKVLWALRMCCLRQLINIFGEEGWWNCSIHGAVCVPNTRTAGEVFKALKVSINKLEGAVWKSKKKKRNLLDNCAQSTHTIACFTVRKVNHKCNYLHFFFFFADVE